MKRILRTTVGLLLGAALAAGMVLLLTPRSGEETRRQLQEWVQGILAEGQQAAEGRRLELTTQFESLKQPKPGP